MLGLGTVVKLLLIASRWLRCLSSKVCILCHVRRIRFTTSHFSCLLIPSLYWYMTSLWLCYGTLPFLYDTRVYQFDQYTIQSVLFTSYISSSADRDARRLASDQTRIPFSGYLIIQRSGGQRKLKKLDEMKEKLDRVTEKRNVKNKKTKKSGSGRGRTIVRDRTETPK